MAVLNWRSSIQYLVVIIVIINLCYLHTVTYTIPILDHVRGRPGRGLACSFIASLYRWAALRSRRYNECNVSLGGFPFIPRLYR